MDGGDGHGAGEASLREVVLLPPGEDQPRPLPSWVAWVALAGLLVLGVSTIPAALRRMRLAANHARLCCENRGQEARLRELDQEVRAARLDTFARERALRALLLPPGTRDGRSAPPR